MDLVYLFKILYKRVWLLITVPIVAGVASFLFTQDLEKEYKSSAQLSTGFTTNNKVQLTKESFDYWESKSNFENLVEMMKSELIGSMVTYSLLLHDLTEEKPYRDYEQSFTSMEIDSIKTKLNDKIKSFELLSSYDDYEKGIIELMIKQKYNFTDWIKDGKLIINRIKDTDFIRVEFTSENPFLSAFVVNKLCEEYIRYNNAMKNTVTEESLLFFATEVEKKKKELDDKTKEVNDYKTSNQVYDYERENNSRLSQLTDYEIKLQAEENNANGLTISLKSIESKISQLSKNNEGSNNSKLLELRNKINELNKIYADSGSKNKELESTINELRTQLQSEMEKLDSNNSTSGKKPKTLSELMVEKDDIELQLAITNSNIESIRSKVFALKNSVSTIGSKEYTISSLESERDNAFRDYTNAVEKFNDVKSRSSISGGGVKLIITGQPNPEPESTKRLAFIAISIAGSLFLCIGVIIGIEYFDYRLKTPERFERFTKVKLLGFLHRIAVKKSGFLNVINNEKERKEVETMMNLLRKIRFLILNSKKQVILVSSTNQADGKSFFIKSLAQSLSLLSVRVLIIDTNFRNNSLTQLIIGNRMLQKQNEYKLLNDNEAYMEISNEDDEYSKSIIFPTTDKNVDIIGSRLGLESPSEMFAGRSFTALINSLRLKYDYILMEGPSLNEYSDTKELTQFADGIIAVFSAENVVTSRDRESINYLKSLNGKFVGAILNFVSKEDIKA
jgi:polysaccharide biosynthesis transport protein